jgi:hypothetical protein
MGKIKKHDFITALLSVMTNRLNELLPDEAPEEDMIGKGLGIMTNEIRHIDVAAHLKKGDKT